jgi:hypothetical protein
MNASSRLLPEFYLDKVDRGAFFAGLLRGDLRIAVGACALFALLALVFVALRARNERLRMGEIAAAVALVALSMSTRAGVALDAFAWGFAALLLLVAGLGERYRWYLPLIVLMWSICTDSGTIGAAIVMLRAFGDLIDDRAFTLRVRHSFAVALACCAASLFSAAGLSYVFSGARSLYFDMLLPGADRQPLWSSPVTLSAIGVFAIVAVAAIGGVARKRESGGVLVFVALLIAAVLDARMAPFFAIAVTPELIDRYASRIRVPAFAGFCFSALVIAAAVIVPPPTPSTVLLDSLAADRRPHRVVCVKPSWCNPVTDLHGSGITALTVGVPSAASVKDRLLQKRIDEDTSAIANDLRVAGADALIANEETAAPALLVAEGGWRVAARDARSDRILIVKEHVR